MMSEKRFVEVDVDGGSLNVAHWPGDGPTLLLVHGISASHMAWQPVINALPADRFNLLAPDLRGRGASAGLPGPYGLMRHVEDLCCVVDALGQGDARVGSGAVARAGEAGASEQQQGDPARKRGAAWTRRQTALFDIARGNGNIGFRCLVQRLEKRCHDHGLHGQLRMY